MEKNAFIEQLKNRTKQFTVECTKIFQTLPKTEESRIFGKQFLRSASSVGANYRAVCRARSKAEFYSKISIVIEEADESLFWMEILIATGIIAETRLKGLMKEAEEILKILSTARKNT